MLYKESNVLAGTGEDTDLPNKQLREYPLRHKFQGYFELSAEDETKNTFILPILMPDQGKGDPTQLIANPMNDAFSPTVHDTPTTYTNSVVNNYRFELKVTVPVAGQETGIYGFLYNAGIVCCSMDDLEADDESGSYTIASTMKLKRETTNEDTVHPDWSGTQLTASTMSTTIPGLTAGAPESVAFNDATFDAVMNTSLRGKLKATVPDGLSDYIAKREVPFIAPRRWYKTPAKVKRQQKGSFLGMMFHVPQGNKQLYIADETTGIDHIRFTYEVAFNEYNDDFYQGAN